MKVSDAAEALAIQICGCADTRQRKADIAAVSAYRDACIREGIEMAAKRCVELLGCENHMADAIRALAGEVK